MGDLVIIAAEYVDPIGSIIALPSYSSLMQSLGHVHYVFLSSVMNLWNWDCRLWCSAGNLNKQ